MTWIIRNCTEAVQRLRDWRASAYRPHRHYMRGPGPAPAKKRSDASPNDQQTT